VTTDIREPFDVQWQVTNTGREAGSDLRGGFYGCDFKNGRWEHTRYKGTHIVEASLFRETDVLPSLTDLSSG